MTAIEIKTEMHKVIDHIPESALQEAFKLLKEIQERSEEELKRDQLFEKIIADNKEVFERLAK
ncbi:MAG: hypothetical protein V4592_24470 [Bacteroidota bacterium]